MGHATARRKRGPAIRPTRSSQAGYELGDYVNAVLDEGCPAENATILLLQGLAQKASRAKKRLVYQCHTFGYCASGCNRSIVSAHDLPCDVRREGGQSLVIGGSSLVTLEGKACNPL